MVNKPTMSRRPPSVRKSRVVLHPSNQPSLNEYTATSYSTISFQIAQQPAFLDTATFRLNGEFYLEDATNALPQNNPGTGNPPPPAANNGATTNPSVGISSLFQEINWSTLNGRNIECLRDANRYLATARPSMNSSLELANGCGNQDPMRADKFILNQRTANVKVQFSVPIECGLLDAGGKGTYLNISSKGFHGLQLDILLTRVEQAISGYYFYKGTQPGDKGVVNATGAPYSYVLKNLTLSYNLLRPDERTFMALPSSGMLEYNTISSLHSTLLSSDQTVNLRFGAQNVASVSHSILPSIHVNNVTEDSLAISPPTKLDAGSNEVVANIKQLRYMRAGVLFPYNFALNSQDQVSLGNQSNHSPQAELMKPALNSVSLYENGHNKFSPLSNIGLNSKNALCGGGPEPLASGPDPSSVYLLGVPMGVDGQGVNFSNREYALRIESELDDILANSLFTFARVKNVAQYSVTGIQIME